MFGNINVINRINGYAYQDTPFLLWYTLIGGGILRR